jgi:hypothetical protein
MRVFAELLLDFGRSSFPVSYQCHYENLKQYYVPGVIFRVRVAGMLMEMFYAF